MKSWMKSLMVPAMAGALYGGNALAVDTTGVIASYSNKCGASAAWCLVAPGSSLGLINKTSGTSTGPAAWAVPRWSVGAPRRISRPSPITAGTDSATIW